MVDAETKKYVKIMIGKLGKKINHELNEKVFDPMDKLIAKVNSIQSTDGNATSRSGNLESIMDPSINMLPTHLKSTVQFTVMVLMMVDRKKESKVIASKILNDYGNVAGREMLDALEKAIASTKKAKLKSVCKEVRKIMDGGT